MTVPESATANLFRGWWHWTCAAGVAHASPVAPVLGAGACVHHGGPGWR